VNEHLVNREKLQQNNKIKLSVRKEINKNYTKHFMPPPKLTAKAYIIYEVKPIKEESRVIVAFNSKNSQEVASLTKIMTCILTLEVCSDFKVDKGRQ
jgi:D-alanyl-D-alanine carboxypeptidase